MEQLLIKLQKLIDEWEDHVENGRYSYPEAAAYADGVESGFIRAAEDLRNVIFEYKKEVKK